MKKPIAPQVVAGTPGVTDEWDVEAIRTIMDRGSGPLEWTEAEKIINRLLAIIERAEERNGTQADAAE